MSNLKREELEALGMTEEQIAAVLSADSNESESSKKIIPMENRGANKVEGASLPVTSISDLQKYAAGAVVRLPDFGDGQPFIARIRRPSMLVLAKQGKIPNKLLNAASELFTKGGSGMDPDNDGMLGDMYNICHIICESALVEPSLSEIENAGIELTDEQMMAIFNYTQTGIKALEPFRKE